MTRKESFFIWQMFDMTWQAKVVSWRIPLQVLRDIKMKIVYSFAMKHLLSVVRGVHELPIPTMFSQLTLDKGRLIECLKKWQTGQV